MSIVAGSSAYTEQADDTPRGWRALAFHPAALGVLLGTALLNNLQEMTAAPGGDGSVNFLEPGPMSQY